MTFDEEVDLYDPVIAERFAALERLSPSDHHVLGLAVTVEPLTQPRPEPGRSRLLLLAAAAVLVAIVGLSAVVLAGGGNRQDLEATEGGKVVVVGADGRSTGAATDGGETKSLTVELPSANNGAGGDVDDQGRSDDGQGPSDGSPVAGAEGQGDRPSESESTATTAAKAVTTQTTVVDPSAKAEGDETTTTTRPPASTATTHRPTTTPGGGSKGTWLNPPTPEKMITIRGKVTEVFTDCQSRLILNSAGEVESIGPISCDGGSYIIVDGTRIQTSSGFVESSDFYGKHPTYLRPGQTVTATAVRTETGGGLMTLDCVQCAVRVGG